MWHTKQRQHTTGHIRDQSRKHTKQRWHTVEDIYDKPKRYETQKEANNKLIAAKQDVKVTHRNGQKTWPPPKKTHTAVPEATTHVSHYDTQHETHEEKNQDTPQEEEEAKMEWQTDDETLMSTTESIPDIPGIPYYEVKQVITN